MKKRIIISAIVLAIVLPVALFAGQDTITYQARLQDSTGIDVNGPATVGFKIYTTLSGNTVLWGETQTLDANKGIVNAELGAVNPLPQDLFSNPDIFIGITLSGDPEMTPRSRLVSTWKAISANKVGGKAIQAGGGTINVSGEATAAAPVTFPKPFSSPPVVMVGAPRDALGGVNFIPTRVTSVTATGCTVNFESMDGSAATGSTEFDWIAIGE